MTSHIELSLNDARADATNDIKRQVAKIHRDPSAPACPHGFAFITQCPTCTPKSEKEVERECDALMKALGWTLVRFSQPRHTMQSFGIPDRRYYPPTTAFTFKPFWLEVKKIGGKQRPDQKKFQDMCKDNGESYVIGGLAELAAHLRENGIADVGIR